MDTEKRLYGAAINGDVRALRELIKEDELVLDRLTLNCFNESPLHIAAMKGHLDFAGELLRRNPQLASELDSRKSSPLHMAAAKGNLETVKILLLAKPEMCLAQDRDGRNPLHLAAMKGRVGAMEELLRIGPAAAAAAVQQRTVSGETVLHLCVKQNRFEAMNMLMEEKTVETQEILNATDSDGNTILHLAVFDKQIETIKYLLKNSQMDVNAMNANGYTSLDILSQGRKDMNDLEMAEILQDAGAIRAKDIPNTHQNTRINNDKNLFSNNNNNYHKAQDWLSRKRDSIMVVASLIATMAFQAGINPPGGVWQEDSRHVAGESVMAKNHINSYRYFVRANTTAFVASLSTILLLISGLPFRRRLFMWFLMVIMWLAITTIALTYGISIWAITPKENMKQLRSVIWLYVMVWCGVMALLLLGNTVRLVLRGMRKTGKIDSWQPRKFGTCVFSNV